MAECAAHGPCAARPRCHSQVRGWWLRDLNLLPDVETLGRRSDRSDVAMLVGVRLALYRYGIYVTVLCRKRPEQVAARGGSAAARHSFSEVSCQEPSGDQAPLTGDVRCIEALRDPSCATACEHGGPIRGLDVRSARRGHAEHLLAQPRPLRVLRAPATCEHAP